MPKINIPVTITLDLPAAAEWADIFKAVDEVKQQPAKVSRTIAPASAKKLEGISAALLSRLEQGGSRFVTSRNLIRAVYSRTGKRIDKNAIHQHIYVLRTTHKMKIETRPLRDGGGYRLAKEES